jgi:ribosomal protein S18 acetylase RimI-like enzyme
VPVSPAVFRASGGGSASVAHQRRRSKWKRHSYAPTERLHLSRGRGEAPPRRGTSELKQMWIDEAYRGRGYGRELLSAFVAEAASRGVRRIWVASYDFQAPRMYEKAGFKRVAEFAGWPEGHSNVVLCKTLIAHLERR